MDLSRVAICCSPVEVRNNVVQFDVSPCFFKLGFEEPGKTAEDQQVLNQPECDAQNWRGQFHEDGKNPDEANGSQNKNL
jgi:hypothetical protein